MIYKSGSNTCKQKKKKKSQILCWKTCSKSLQEEPLLILFTQTHMWHFSYLDSKLLFSLFLVYLAKQLTFRLIFGSHQRKWQFQLLVWSVVRLAVKTLFIAWWQLHGKYFSLIKRRILQRSLRLVYPSEEVCLHTGGTVKTSGLVLLAVRCLVSWFQEKQMEGGRLFYLMKQQQVTEDKL